MSDSDRFRFDLSEDEEAADFALEEERDRRIARLERRVSLITILLPLLLAIAFYAAWQDLSERFPRPGPSAANPIERLYTDLEQMRAQAEERLAGIEQSLAEQRNVLTRELPLLQEAVRKAVSEVEKMEGAKADKKEVAEALSRIEGPLETVRKELQSQGAEVKALSPFREELGTARSLRDELQEVSERLRNLENRLAKDLTGIAGFIERSKTDLEKIKTELAELKGRKLDRETLELENLKTKRLYQLALEQEVSRLEKSLSALQRRIEQLERAFGTRSRVNPGLPPLTGDIQEKPLD
ncbi:MAG: hypothetical protein WHT06_13870 [Desulfobacterales bacterium]